MERGTASAVTYLIASFVGTGGAIEGEYLVNRAQYLDELVETGEGWRVVNRTLVYMVCGSFLSSEGGMFGRDVWNGFANRE